MHGSGIGGFVVGRVWRMYGLMDIFKGEFSGSSIISVQ